MRMTGYALDYDPERKCLVATEINPDGDFGVSSIIATGVSPYWSARLCLTPLARIHDADLAAEIHAIDDGDDD